MTNKGKKMEPPLRLDMSFTEAMSRFVATKPAEIDDSIERSKSKRPPQDGPPRRSGRSNNADLEKPGRSRKPSIS